MLSYFNLNNVISALNNSDYAAFVAAWQPVLPAINAFFDNNLVMSEDLIERANRIAGLKQISDLMHRFVL